MEIWREDFGEGGLKRGVSLIITIRATPDDDDERHPFSAVAVCWWSHGLVVLGRLVWLTGKRVGWWGSTSISAWGRWTQCWRSMRAALCRQAGPASGTGMELFTCPFSPPHLLHRLPSFVFCPPPPGCRLPQWHPACMDHWTTHSWFLTQVNCWEITDWGRMSVTCWSYDRTVRIVFSYNLQRIFFFFFFLSWRRKGKRWSEGKRQWNLMHKEQSSSKFWAVAA